MNRRAILTLFCGAAAALTPRLARAVDNRPPAILYKDPDCGCCEGYASYLKTAGFKVTVSPTHDLPLLYEKYGVPADLEPCHISLLGSYVVGGHVPLEVLERLLAEKPAITGITLPGMPLGSPGMNGTKMEPFTIYEIAKGSRKVYAVV